MSNGVFAASLWTGSFSKEGVSGIFLLLLYSLESQILNTRSVDPYLTACSVASDLACTVVNVCFMGR